jgi:protein-tyrosine phosphatase
MAVNTTEDFKHRIAKVAAEVESEAAVAFGEAEKLAGRPLYPIHWYIAEVDPGKLWRGAWPNAKDLDALKARGVVESINLCAERSQDAVIKSAGLFPFNIPIVDNTAPSEDDVREMLAIVKPSGGPVFIHCEQGQGRTGCMVAAYRVLVNGWKPEDALAEAEHFGLKLESQKAFILGLGAKEERVEG